MISKLDKYSEYIKLALNIKKQRIKEAKASQSFRAPNPQANYKFQQENFAALTAFDSVKQENAYKLQTYRQNCTNGSPKAIVAMFHGLHSHVQRGAHIANYFAQKGITTVGYDYRGFGQSEGPRGLIYDLNSHLGDAQKFINLVKANYPNVPLFAYGISLGGATSYLLSLKHRNMFEGVILQAPALMPSMELSQKVPSIINLCDILQIFLPIQLKIVKVKLEDHINNPQVIEDTLADELYIKQRVKLRTINTLFYAMEKAHSSFANYDCPFMVIQGGLDKLVSPQVAFELFSKSKTAKKDKQILFYEDVWHNIWHDQKIEEINQKISQWILGRSKKLI